MKRIELGLRMVALSIVLVGVLELRAKACDDLTDEINRVRAQYGLPGLTHDPELATWAAENNRYGMGHRVLGPARFQNAAGNFQSVGAVVAAWMSSAGHRAGLLASDVTHCGGSYNGSCWTWNAANYTGRVVVSTPQTMPGASTGQTLNQAVVPPPGKDSSGSAPAADGHAFTPACVAGCSNAPAVLVDGRPGRRGLFRRLRRCH